MKFFSKLFKRENENSNNKIEKEELVNIEFFMKPWLYKFNFTFASKNNPCYSRRDCYKESTGKCLLEKKGYEQKEGPVEVYDSCLGLKKYLEKFPKPYNTLPFITSSDGKVFNVADGQHRLCVAIREKIEIYVNAQIPKSKIKEIKNTNETDIHICEF
ncbi:hypothetical protein HMPREF9094_1238 [Fusobacterium animalis ATCC 51191]|uniref:ParB/Sulfiredoxin domain-containing protein n=1 Tax=Fusobacterium animalis ATCC 51191 TaxID=997347 RepID=F9EMT3_9FUSO|nr:hypothetical protein HMPREF9094_1238 [Fusobacterium animalis ATCC 51191]